MLVSFLTLNDMGDFFFYDEYNEWKMYSLAPKGYSRIESASDTAHSAKSGK